MGEPALAADRTTSHDADRLAALWLDRLLAEGERAASSAENVAAEVPLPAACVRRANVNTRVQC